MELGIIKQQDYHSVGVGFRQFVQEYLEIFAVALVKGHHQRGARVGRETSINPFRFEYLLESAFRFHASCSQNAAHVGVQPKPALVAAAKVYVGIWVRFLYLVVLLPESFFLKSSAADASFFAWDFLGVFIFVPKFLLA